MSDTSPMPLTPLGSMSPAGEAMPLTRSDVVSAPASPAAGAGTNTSAPSVAALLNPLNRAAAPPVSAEVPDWSREAKPWFAWWPSRSLLASLRRYQRHRARRSPWSRAVCVVAVWQHRFWSVVTGADIPINCRIGGGLLLPHPNGVVIHDLAEIGPNCLIFQQVTIGADGAGVPRIGGHVDIGAGAKVIGPVDVGAHARIGANAVVVHDVPVGATAVGIPARVIR